MTRRTLLGLLPVAVVGLFVSKVTDNSPVVVIASGWLCEKMPTGRIQWRQDWIFKRDGKNIGFCGWGCYRDTLSLHDRFAAERFKDNYYETVVLGKPL